ncbi:uncharacterized protein LOC143044824 [Mytilus galloprovincialis]|uniref:uncharacterized protein LOC143044824 n=1 Tax=Mytilus galloprovincialis TaxID=29158 RepID=UPI003F7B53B6
MSDFMSGYKDCYVTSKTITVTYQCSDITARAEKTYVGPSIPYDIIGIVTGVCGGIVLTIIAVVVICRLEGLNGCELVTKNITFPNRKRQENKIKETCVYESSNISSRLSDHAYDSLECPNYYNMKNVPNSST